MVEATASVVEPKPRQVVETLIDRTADMLASLLEADLLGVAHLRDDGSALELEIRSPDCDAEDSQICQKQLDPQALAELYTSVGSRAVVTTDSRSERSPLDGTFLDALHIQSVLTLPIGFSGRMIGAICAYRTSDRPFREEDAAKVTAVAESLEEIVRLVADAVPSGSMFPDTAADGMDHRTSPRSAFRFVQEIGPVVEGKLPSSDRFFEVECCDVSAGGFSFYLDAPPPFETLIVRLGNASQKTFVSAQVAHVRQMVRQGQTAYMIGCQFTGRIHII